MCMCVDAFLPLLVCVENLQYLRRKLEEHNIIPDLLLQKKLNRLFPPSNQGKWKKKKAIQMRK